MATTSRTTPKPKKPVAHFSVAQVRKERDDDVQIEPFVVELSTGETVTLKNPDDVGWKAAASMTPEEPFLTFRIIVPEEDQETFFADDFEVYVMKKLIEAWREHYGLPSSGE